MKLTHIVISVIFFCAVSLITSPIVNAEPTAAEYGVVLNLSGKQRMLSQKMSKEITLIALKVDADANLANLAATSALFDKTLKGLRSGDETLGLPATESKRVIRQLDKVEKIWMAFYPAVQDIIQAKSVSQEQLSLIASKNLPLLKQMNKAVGLYEKEAKKSGLKAAPGLAATLNLSGKQRMLSQKMSKEFFLIALGHEVEQNKLNLLETYSLFDRTLKGLKDGDEVLGLPSTEPLHIREQLDVVNGLWIKFMPLVVHGADYKTQKLTQDEIGQVAASNLPLLKQMNAAVKLYEKEAAK